MKTKIQAMKEKIEAKKTKAKGKLAAKVKARKRNVAAAAALFLCAALCGCMDTNPASRANSNRFGDVEPGVKVVIGENACSNTVSVTVPVTIGDGVLASADSAGSTETQTATPTLDIRTKIDARYNDAISGATAASKGVLGSIGDGITAVLDMMQSKKSGTVQVTKTDGTCATVKCENGQCEFAEDCAECTDCMPN